MAVKKTAPAATVTVSPFGIDAKGSVLRFNDAGDPVLVPVTKA